MINELFVLIELRRRNLDQLQAPERNDPGSILLVALRDAAQREHTRLLYLLVERVVLHDLYDSLYAARRHELVAHYRVRSTHREERQRGCSNARTVELLIQFLYEERRNANLHARFLPLGEQDRKRSEATLQDVRMVRQPCELRGNGLRGLASIAESVVVREAEE